MKTILTLGAIAVFASACNSNVQIDTSSGTDSGPGGAGSAGAGPGGAGGDIGPGGDAGAGGTGGVEPPSDVKGTVVYRYYGDTTTVDQPQSLFGLQVQALVQEAGAWKIYPGSGKEDGSFLIPAVPAGPFMLDVAGTYVYTTARDLDLGAEIGGRPGAVYAQGGAQIAGDVDNLSPWSALDQIEWLSPNAAGAAYGFASATPMVGATKLMSEPCPWYGFLNDSAAGDTLYLTQLSAQPGSPTVYSIVRFAAFPDVKQADGVTTTAMGLLTSVTADQTISIDFPASQLAKLGPSVNPKGQGYGAVLDLATLPGAAEAGLFSYTGDVLLVYPGEADTKFPMVSYGNPFPSTWGVAAYAGETWGVTYKAPGASGAALRYDSIYVMMPVDEAGAGPIVPVVGPVQDAQVDGKSAFGPLDGISTAPVLTWKEPALGKASAYRVLVYELTNAGGATQSKYVAMISTTTTTLPMPPDILQQGHAYAFTITAVSSPVDAEKAPFRIALDYAAADVLTSMALP